MYNRLEDMNVDGKRVIVRVDYNVPIKDGKILDDNKIRESLPTLNYLLDKGCKVILLSHLGKVKTKEDAEKNTLEPVALHLQELIKRKVTFSKQTRSFFLEETASNLLPGEILMLENTRVEDLDGKRESGNDPQLASYWASLGDVFVMDAFGSAHRAHASTSGIAKYLPSCIGLLVEKEIEMLDKYVLNPEHPFTVVMGGAKIDDKLALIKKLIPKCDNLLLTGGLANTCLKVLGVPIGESIACEDESILKEVNDLLKKYKSKIMLPLDVIVGNNYDPNYVDAKTLVEIKDDDKILDVGYNTLKKYQTAIDSSKTIFVNGTAGMYENPKFANGTKEMFRIMSESKASIIVGGGDSVSAAINFGYKDKFTYLSTGGGATLEYICDGKLIALEGLKKGEESEVLDL